jgi:peroxiredoxin
MNEATAAERADSTGAAGGYAPQRVDRATLAVLAALIFVGAGWLAWAHRTAAPRGGPGWGPMDSILAASAGRQIGRPAPPIVLTDPAGRTHSLEELRGQVVLVNFWASWCAPCRVEMPELDLAAREYGAAGFQVLAVNVQDGADAVRRFGEELKLQSPLLLDPTGDVAKSYKVAGLPTSFLVDRDGMIRDARYGVLARSYLDARLPGLLSP